VFVIPVLTLGVWKLKRGSTTLSTQPSV
jgi:hypothetical protein